MLAEPLAEQWALWMWRVAGVEAVPRSLAEWPITPLVMPNWPHVSAVRDGRHGESEQ